MDITKKTPIEIWVQILCRIPTTKDEDIEATLLKCLQVNSIIRNAALSSRVWERPYRARYTHNVEAKEDQRKKACGDDWRLMYIQRRCIDREALAILDQARLSDKPWEHKWVRNIVRHSYDIWDALKLESQLPVPPCFDEGQEGKPVPADALLRRYWAQTMLGVIARHHAVMVWVECINTVDEGRGASVATEPVIAGISAFWGVPLVDVLPLFDDLYHACEERLLSRGLVLSMTEAGCDFWAICDQLYRVLGDLGYRCTSTQPETTHKQRYYYPHLFLKQGQGYTAPTALAFIYVAMARRLGINAIQCQSEDFRRVVIQPMKAERPAKVLDVVDGKFLEVAEDIVSPEPVYADLVMLVLTRYLSASSAWDWAYSRPGFHEEYKLSEYCGICGEAMAIGENLTLLASAMPIDNSAIIVDVARRTLSPLRQLQLQADCAVASCREMNKAKVVKHRFRHPIKYPVGLFFKHQFCEKNCGVGCIVGWDPRCIPAMTAFMKIKDVDQPFNDDDWNQPYYHTLCLDGAYRYVAEANIVLTETPDKAILPILLKCRSDFSRLFSDYEEVETTCRGRLVPSRYLRAQYPEDDPYASRWVHGQVDFGTVE